MNMPRSTSARVPPFIIDRKSTKNFPDQMTDGLRQAIVSGYYRPGERLPTIREFSKLLHVSIRAPLEAIDRLRPEERTLLHLRYYDGQSLQEIAEVMDVAAGPLANRLQRIRQKLSKLIRL